MTPAKTEFTPPKKDQPCPCGTGKTLAECCDPILTGQRKADNAEQLMRSRFTAHVAHNFEHLHKTYLKTSKEPYEPDPDAGGTHWDDLLRLDRILADFFAFLEEWVGLKNVL